MGSEVTLGSRAYRGGQHARCGGGGGRGSRALHELPSMGDEDDDQQRDGRAVSPAPAPQQAHGYGDDDGRTKHNGAGVEETRVRRAVAAHQVLSGGDEADGQAHDANAASVPTRARSRRANAFARREWWGDGVRTKSHERDLRLVVFGPGDRLGQNIERRVSGAGCHR